MWKGTKKAGEGYDVTIVTGWSGMHVKTSGAFAYVAFLDHVEEALFHDIFFEAGSDRDVRWTDRLGRALSTRRMT